MLRFPFFATLAFMFLIIPSAFGQEAFDIEETTEIYLNAWENAYQADSNQKDWDRLASFYEEEFEFSHTRWRETFKMTKEDVANGAIYQDYRKAKLIVMETMIGESWNVSIIKLRKQIEERTEGECFIDRSLDEIWVLVFNGSGKIRQKIMFD